METRLHTQNGLATALRKDRATIKRAVVEIEPEGKVGGYDAWFLPDVAAAVGVDGGDPLAIAILDRVFSLTDHSVRPSQLVTIEAMAKSRDTTTANVLMWLKAGMPYHTEGDWQTGAGFLLRGHWAADWLALVGARLERNAPATAALLDL